MKWFIIFIVAVLGIWVYFNVDFSQIGNHANQTIRQEKTLKKFFDADQQNKEQTRRTIEENF